MKRIASLFIIGFLVVGCGLTKEKTEYVKVEKPDLGLQVQPISLDGFKTNVVSDIKVVEVGGEKGVFFNQEAYKRLQKFLLSLQNQIDQGQSVIEEYHKYYEKPTPK